MSRKRPATAKPVVADEAAITAAVDPLVPSARGKSVSVLIFEGGKTNLKRAEELVQGLGYRAVAIEEPAEAEQLVASEAAPDLALIGLPGGEALARALSGRGDDRPSVVLALSGSTSEAVTACNQLGGDAFVIRPYKRDGLACALRAAEAVRRERRRAVQLAAELAAERARLLRFGEVDPSTGFHHLEFFKRLLVIELKRARRYGYSLAACLVAIDDARLGPIVPATRLALCAQVAVALRGVIRDIDLPVDYADGRFLVFLPYTDLSGAERVGRRLEASVRQRLAAAEGERTISATISVGIAALKPGRAVSFAKLIRDASLALRAAQLKGGAQVVVRD